MQRHELDTTDPEQAHAWLREEYQVRPPRLSGDHARFRMRVVSVDIGAVRVDDCLHTMTVDNVNEPLGALAVLQPRVGRLWARDAGETIQQGPGGVLLLDPQRQVRSGCSPMDLQIVRIQLEPALALIAGLADTTATVVRFPTSVPVSTGRARHWSRVVEQVCGVLADDRLAGEPLIGTEVLTMLATALLTTFPNTALDALRTQTGPAIRRVEPSAVRRAVEYLDANAHDAVTPPDVADVARTSVRALASAFRRHRGHTPRDHLERVRMDAAHRALRDADPSRGDTVATIAARWGFVDIGRFRVAYTRAFGQSPETTLQR